MRSRRAWAVGLWNDRGLHARRHKVAPAEAQGDHIYPRSKGGDGATVDDMRNLETICAKCNRAKGATIE
ncbi:HNH endonuclease [Enhygromyxa salina]|uniref:HNH endonuclease n=1 Tax=Enhygromyxa salina TaxID=215803 RepID=UPI003B8A67A3